MTNRLTAVLGAGRPTKNVYAKRGMLLYLGIALVLLALAFKPQILSFFASGDTIKAEFSSSYKLRPLDSSVKVAGLVVGDVTGISYTNHHTAIVTMKVDHDALAGLGSQPLASIEERTLLGGRYTVNLRPGGGPGTFNGFIPLAHTRTPTELDAVIDALPSTARSALQGLVGRAGATLKSSTPALHALLGNASGTLVPGTSVVGALRGENPATDLTSLVTNLEKTASVLTAKDGQLASIVANLNQTSAILAENRVGVASTLHDLPQTIHEAHLGIAGLTQSITQLQTTAADLMPSAPKITNLVSALRPALDKLAPVLVDLKPALADANPVVGNLIPVVKGATGIVKNLKGPVLDRVNGPVAKFILNPWVGKGPYLNGASGYMANQKFYEELAYMATNIDRASMTQDHYGSTLAFQAGVGLDSISGLPFNLQNIVNLALKQVGITSPKLQQLALLKAVSGK